MYRNLRENTTECAKESLGRTTRVVSMSMHWITGEEGLKGRRSGGMGQDGRTYRSRKETGRETSNEELEEVPKKDETDRE